MSLFGISILSFANRLKQHLQCWKTAFKDTHWDAMMHHESSGVDGSRIWILQSYIIISFTFYNDPTTSLQALICDWWLHHPICAVNGWILTCCGWRGQDIWSCEGHTGDWRTKRWTERAHPSFRVSCMTTLHTKLPTNPGQRNTTTTKRAIGWKILEADSA